MRIRVPHRRPARTRIRNSLFPFLFSIFIVLGACAAPGEPVARRAPVPAPITNLAAEQSGNSATLTFVLPHYTIEHKLLKRPPDIEIYRSFSSTPPSNTVASSSAPPIAESPTSPGAAPVASAAPATTMPVAEATSSSPGLSLLITIPSALASHYEQDGAVRYTDQWTPDILKQYRGKFAVYMVRTAESRKKTSPDSNLAGARVYPAPNPISDLKAQLARSAIDLTWTAPQQTPVGPAPPIKAYEIYRSEISSGKTSNTTAATPEVLPIPGKKESAAQPQKIATTESASYEDIDISLGATYQYSVRSTVEDSGESVESADSNAVTITMRDVFPPSAPTGLVAVPVPAENGTSPHLDLSWNVNPETDVTGYNVYRSEQESTPGPRLNSQLLPTPVFSDMSAVAGQHYFYRVTAVDRSGNESQPSAAVSAEVPAESQPKQ
jgi:hypothetical protein